MFNKKLYKHRLIVALTLVFILAFTGWAVGQGGGVSDGEPKYIKLKEKAQSVNSVYAPDEIIVKFKKNAGKSDKLAAHSKVGGKVLKENKVLGFSQVKFAKNFSLNQALELYKKNPLIEYAYPNSINKAFFTPNDPYYSNQWSMPKIKADLAWDITRGNTAVKVAVLDSGVDLDHPDLVNNLVAGYNAVNTSQSPQDDNGHGTHVAGTVAATLNNGVGVAGLGGAVKIIPVKVLFQNADGEGVGYDSDIAEGIQWAADNGAKVINLSLGGPVYNQAVQDAVNYAYNKGVVVIAAVGNDGNTTINYPAGYNNVIGVAATDKNDGRAYYSNYNRTVDLSAPGGDGGATASNQILSTYLDNAYAYSAGTSMATPHVAGLAALMLSHDSSLTNAQVEQTLYDTVVDLGTAGRDDYYGYGRIDAYAALGGGTSTGGSSTTTPTDIYIDPVNGSDSNNGLTSTSAKKTFAAGWALIPGLFDQNVTVHLAAGTFYEQFEPNGKTPSGPYSITIQGATSTLVSNTTADIYSATSIGKSGLTWSTDAYKGKIVEIVSGTGSGQKAIIKSNTSTTLNIAGQWRTTPDSTSVFTVKSLQTVIDGQNAKSYNIYTTGQENLTIQYIKGINSNVASIRTNSPFFVFVRQSELGSSTNGIMGVKVHIFSTFINGGGNGSLTNGGVRPINGGYIGIWDSTWINGVNGPGVLSISPVDYVSVFNSTISNTSKYGVYAYGGIINKDTYGQTFIENCDNGNVGARAENKGSLLGFSSATYSGQATNYSAETSTYSLVN